MLRKIKIAAMGLAAMSMALPSYSVAAQNPTIPSGFTVYTVYVDNVHARPGPGQTEVFVKDQSGKTYDVVFKDCNVQWRTNEAFYLILADGIGAFLTPVDGFDKALGWNRNSFNDALSVIIETNKLCEVIRFDDEWEQLQSGVKEDQMSDQCIGDAYGDCENEASYIRHTQFAGSHPLCEKHAKEDKNFMVSDSYQVWEKI